MASASGKTDADRVTLSTGHTLDLPVRMESSVTTVILSADRERTAELLPEGLSPIRAAPGRAAVSLMSARHRNVDGGTLDDYEEFAVLISATPGSPDGIPYLSPMLRTDAYVWCMHVTTDPARAFGEDVWGYPKTVADIDITDEDGTRRTRVRVDGERLLTFEIDLPPTRSREDELVTFAEKDGELLRIPAEAAGEIGVWPLSTAFSYDLGGSPRADTLRELDFGSRSFARLHADGDLAFHEGDPVRRQ